MLTLVVLALVPGLLTTLYHAVQEREAVIEGEQQHLLRLARIFSIGEREIVTRTHDLLTTLAFMKIIREGKKAECQGRLAVLNETTRYYANLGVTDASGNLICDARGTQKPVSFADRSWLQQSVKTRKFVTSDLLVSRITGRPVIVLTNPLLNAQGQVERILYASLDFGQLRYLLERVNIPKGAAVNVIDAAGVTVARHPEGEKHMGKRSALAPVLEGIRTKKMEGLGAAVDADGNPQLYAYQRVFGVSVPGSIYISVTTPTAPLFAERNRLFATDITVLLLTALMIFVLAWVGTELLILGKIKTLLHAARKIAQGNFRVRTQAGAGGGEFAELGRVFDDMAESLELLFQQSQHIMEVTPEAIIVTDGNGKIAIVNGQAEKLFGYSRNEMIGEPIEMLVPERLRSRHIEHRNAYLEQEASTIRVMGAGREIFARKKDGTEFATEISLGPLITKDGNYVISAVRDVTERKEFEAQILHQATHDALTGLPNRLFFNEMLEHAAAHAYRTEKLLAVLFLDLDGFKKINDTLGHLYGDHLLKEIARRLTLALRGNDLIARDDDIVARQGGDEFTILLQGIAHVQNIVQVAERILTVVSETFFIEGHEMHVTTSIGITVFPLDDKDVQRLLQNADTALYRAKENGKNNFQFFTAEMEMQIRERLTIENGLRQALVHNQLVLHYQPQMDIKTGKMVGVEALVRWMHPEKGLISPAVFIPVAEESGLIVSVGEWVLRNACQQRKIWYDAGLPHLRIAVNLSARQFRDPRLVTMVAQALKDAGLDSHSDHIELELTESLLMQDTGDTIGTLHALNEMGLCLSIDDFGTGYSSLGYLKRFPIHTLKIDQSFIRDMTRDSQDAAIAATIVTLAHNMKLTVIAEGVETAEQLALLREMDCDQIQGYYFSRPLPAEDLERLLREGRRLTDVGC